MLDHLRFNFHSARNINAIPVNVKLVIDFHNMVVILQVNRKLIKQKCLVDCKIKLDT